MKSKNNFKILIIIGLFFTNTVLATTVEPSGNEKSCSSALTNETLIPREKGLHYRGFLGTLPKRTEATEVLMQERGVSWWGLRIYVMPTLELARKFDNFSDNQNLLMKGVYLIDPEMNLDETLNIYDSLNTKDEQLKEAASLRQKEIAANSFKTALAKNGMWYFKDNEAIQVPTSQIELLFTPDQLELKETETNLKMPEEGNEDRFFGSAFIYQRGWFYTKIVGVIKTQDFIDKHAPGGSSRFMKLRQKARSLIENKAWKVLFNTNIEAVIELSKKQVRKGQEGDSANRFTEEDYINFRKSFSEGTLFTVEVWDGEGQLAAATFGLQTGNIYHPESLLYTLGIDLSNFTLMALLERLHEKEIAFLNAGMVTPNTANMGGVYLTRSEYEALLATLPATTQTVDFNTPWEPYPQWLKDLRGNNN
ncbi:MAG: hypothetical protein H6625_10100 [Bdellovibrionaceae bacterium]|nr:hypothetical protein [Pseudobdellovibrionaceae bacterium]